MDSRILLIIGNRLIGLYLDGSDLSPEFLKTGQTDESFQDDGNIFQWGNDWIVSPKLEQVQRQCFFRTTTGISSGPVAFEIESLPIYLCTSFTVSLIFEMRQFVREGNSGMGDPWSSRFPFSANKAPNRVALSFEEKGTFGPLCNVWIVDLPLFRTLLVIFQNCLEPRACSSICNLSEALKLSFADRRMREHLFLAQAGVKDGWELRVFV